MGGWVGGLTVRKGLGATAGSGGGARGGSGKDVLKEGMSVCVLLFVLGCFFFLFLLPLPFALCGKGASCPPPYQPMLNIHHSNTNTNNALIAFAHCTNQPSPPSPHALQSLLLPSIPSSSSSFLLLSQQLPQPTRHLPKPAAIQHGNHHEAAETLGWVGGWVGGWMK